MDKKDLKKQFISDIKAGVPVDDAIERALTDSGYTPMVFVREGARNNSEIMYELIGFNPWMIYRKVRREM